MSRLCLRIDGDESCIPLDLTVFDDPRQDDVNEMPGQARGNPVTTSDAAVVRTKVARGAVPEEWPRGQRTMAEFEKGSERIQCQLLVRKSGGRPNTSEEILLFGDDVFQAILGRAP